VPKPSPVKKRRANTAAKVRLQRGAKRTPKVLAKKPRTARSASSQKATVRTHRSSTVPKRAQSTHAKEISTDRSAGKSMSRDEKPRQLIRTASLKQYEAAVRFLYSHDYEKARIAFEKVIATFADDKEVLERCRIHLRLCEQKLARRPSAARTLDEHYDVAIALMNQGKYDESIDHLNRALKSDPKCDYVIYALAATQCRTGDFDSALANLQTAISLKPENRFLAQRDSDFETLKQDSRFASLVFPDQPPAPTR